MTITIEPKSASQEQTLAIAKTSLSAITAISWLNNLYENNKAWIKNIALIFSTVGVIMLWGSISDVHNGTGEAYKQIAKWGFFSAILIGYYLSGSPKGVFFMLIALVIFCIILVIFNLTIADLADFCQGKHIKGSSKAKIEFREARNSLYDFKLDTAKIIMQAKAKVRVVISTEAYREIPAGSKMVIVNQTPIKEDFDSFIKVALIENNKINSKEIKFPSRLLKTDYEHFNEPIIPYNKMGQKKGGKTKEDNKRLEFERALGRMIAGKGEPDIDELIIKKNDYFTIFENPKLNDGFIYLASSNFIGFDDAGPAEYPSALKNPKTVEYTGYKYINGALKIRKKDNNVRVVIWKLNSS